MSDQAAHHEKTERTKEAKSSDACHAPGQVPFEGLVGAGEQQSQEQRDRPKDQRVDTSPTLLRTSSGETTKSQPFEKNELESDFIRITAWQSLNEDHVKINKRINHFPKRVATLFALGRASLSREFG